MRERAKAYVDAGLLTEEVAERIMSVILSERNHEEFLNEGASDAPEHSNLTTKLTQEQLQQLLEEREAMMQQGSEDSDQWRVYQYVVNRLQTGMYLRLMVQASAGTGVAEGFESRERCRHRLEK